MVIHPFTALRCTPESAEQVASAPYDVVSSDEARHLAQDKPLSFLRVVRSEITLPPDSSPYDPTVYQRAAENLQALRAGGHLIAEQVPSLYAYRMTMGDHAQLGLLACCSVDEYDRNLIKKHELTRKDKEDDRTNHILTTRSQCGPVLIAYRDDDDVQRLLAQAAAAAPLLRATSETGVVHELWRLEDSAPLSNAFARIPGCYIADGHHRSASASRARARLQQDNPAHTGQEEYNFFLSAMFPASQMDILAYNRVVKDLGGLSGGDLLGRAAERFDIQDATDPVPLRATEFCVYLDGRWRLLKIKSGLLDHGDAVRSLDCSLLQEHFIEPILGIRELRTDPRISFVGGIRGTPALERLVDGGQAAIAFSMYPTSMQQLMAIADAGAIMPPKSTWFEPKLRSGLVVHLI